MYGGSCSYLWHVYTLREALGLTSLGVIGSVCNAVCWPLLWSTSIACLLDETPSWLLEGLRRVESHLPTVLRSSLFLDPPALYPVCKLLQGVIVDEDMRRQTVLRHAAGKWSLTKPVRAPLTDLDVVAIITRRLERLETLRAALNSFARSERAVPTVIAAPMLDKLRTEIEQLEKVRLLSRAHRRRISG